MEDRMSECRVKVSGQAANAAPPSLIGGAKCHTSVGVDWLRCSGCREMRHTVSAWFSSMWGEPAMCKGLYFYSHRMRWVTGAQICFDLDPEGARHCTVELPGSCLGAMEGSEVLNLMRRLLALEFKGTRVDVAIDLSAEAGGLHLIDDVIAACQAGELTGARRWRVVEDNDNRRGKLGSTVYLGTRGKNGSGRMVRVYDKGLESGQAAAGHWQRWEAEFSSLCACQVWECLCASADWKETARAFALGCVDFRHSGSQRASRRARSLWWSQVIEGTNCVRVRAIRLSPDFERWQRWALRAVAPTLKAMQHVTGLSFQELWVNLGFQDADPVKDAMKRPVIWEWYTFHVERQQGFSWMERPEWDVGTEEAVA